MPVTSIKSNMMFDNMWQDNHIFLGESSDKIIILIPYSFEDTGHSKAMTVIMDDFRITCTGMCHEKCWEKNDYQLQYRVNNQDGNDQMVSVIKDLKISNDLLSIEVVSSKKQNIDCVNFINGHTISNCLSVAWRSKCCINLKAKRQCVPQLIKGKIRSKEYRTRKSTGINLIKTNPYDLF